MQKIQLKQILTVVFLCGCRDSSNVPQGGTGGNDRHRAIVVTEGVHIAQPAGSTCTGPLWSLREFT